MAIKNPESYSLGANVRNFPKTQYDKIVEIITVVNELSDGSITTDNLTLTGDLIVGDDATITGDLFVDTISERTAGAGVTVDGVLLKDSSIALADGSVGNLAIKIGADINNGFYGVSDVQLGVVIEGVLVAVFDANGLAVNIISELIVGNGVTIDGVLLKDGQVYTGSVPSYSLGTGSEFVVIAGDDLVDTAPQYFTTGDVGYITSETGTQTFGTGSLRTGATVVTAASDVASLKATLLILSGTDVTADAATLETFNGGYGAGIFVPGVYTTASAIGVSAAATLTFSGDGDYVIKSTGGAMTFGAGVNVVLTNGAKASRIFWVASTDLSTTGATSSLKGNFLMRDITVAATNTIEGRMLASRDVTIDGTATNMYLPLS